MELRPSLQFYTKDHGNYSPKTIAIYISSLDRGEIRLKIKEMLLTKDEGWTTLISFSELRSVVIPPMHMDLESVIPLTEMKFFLGITRLKVEILSNHDQNLSGISLDTRISGVRVLSDSSIVESIYPHLSASVKVNPQIRESVIVSKGCKSVTFKRGSRVIIRNVSKVEADAAQRNHGGLSPIMLEQLGTHTI